MMTDDEALLFYAQAARRAVRELAELEAKQEPNWSDRRHYVFCEHSTHPIFVKKLVEKTRSSDQGLRFAGHYGLYQFERAMTYKCDN